MTKNALIKEILKREGGKHQRGEMLCNTPSASVLEEEALKKLDSLKKKSKP